MHVVYLPFLDDIRNPESDLAFTGTLVRGYRRWRLVMGWCCSQCCNYNTVSSNDPLARRLLPHQRVEPSEQQVEAADALISNLQLGAFYSDAIANPHLQRHYQAREVKAVRSDLLPVLLCPLSPNQASHSIRFRC